MKTGTTNWRERFDKRFVVKNYEADAHTIDSNLLNLPDDVKNFIETVVIAEMIEEATELFENKPLIVDSEIIKQYLKSKWLSKDYEEKK